MNLWISIGPNAFELIVNKTTPNFFTIASALFVKTIITFQLV